MEIVAPVTDYIPASVLTALGDIVVRGAAGPERLPDVNWRGTFCLFGNSNVNGLQVVSGVPFQPNHVIFLCYDHVDSNLNWSIGFDKQIGRACMFQDTNGTAMGLDTTYSCHIDDGVGNSQMGRIQTWNPDGWDFTWLKAGAGRINYIYLCFPS